MRMFTCHLCNYSTGNVVLWSLHLLSRKHRCQTLHYAAREPSRWGNKGKSLILVAVSSNTFSPIVGKEDVQFLKKSVNLKLLMHFVKEKGVVIEDIVWSAKDPYIAYLRFTNEKQLEKIMEHKNRWLVSVGRAHSDIVVLHKAASYSDIKWNLKMESLLASVATVKDILTLK